MHRNERQNTLPAKASFYETDVFGAYPNDANTNPEQQSASVHGSVDLKEHQRQEKVGQLIRGHVHVTGELLVWLKVTGAKWADAFDEVGESTDECRQVEKEHRQLVERSKVCACAWLGFKM